MNRRKKNDLKTRLWAAGALVGVLAVGGTARAQETPTCASLNLPNPTYGSGGNAGLPLISRVSAALAALPANERITLLYQYRGACFGVDEVLDDLNFGASVISYWEWEEPANPAKTVEKQCTLPITGAKPSWAHSVTSAGLCAGRTPEIPAGVKDFLGPVSTVNLFTHPNSTQHSISAEAAHFIYRFGQAANIAPWTINGSIGRRNAGAAVQATVGAASGLDINAFLDVLPDTGSNPGSVAFVADQHATPNNAIGFASGETVDANRDGVRTLAFKAFGQNVGYLPDSTNTAFDKINVRTGRYDIWSSQHIYSKVDGNGNIADPNTAKFVGYLTGSLPTPAGLSHLPVLVIQAGSIPNCAMYVARDGDPGSDVYSAPPPEPCHGFFEKTATGATSHPEGATDAECVAKSAEFPKSRNGFCEKY